MILLECRNAWLTWCGDAPKYSWGGYPGSMHSKLTTWKPKIGNWNPTLLCILILYPFNAGVNVIMWNPLHHWDVMHSALMMSWLVFVGKSTHAPDQLSGNSHSEQRCWSRHSDGPFYEGCNGGLRYIMWHFPLGTLMCPCIKSARVYLFKKHVEKV